MLARFCIPLPPQPQGWKATVSYGSLLLPVLFGVVTPHAGNSGALLLKHMKNCEISLCAVYLGTYCGPPALPPEAGRAQRHSTTAPFCSGVALMP